MNQLTGLQNIFSSNFYIDGQYAMSFAPTFVQLLQGKFDFEEKTKERLVANSLSETKSDQSEKTVAVLSIKQPILKYTDYYFGYLGSKTFISILKNLESKNDILGVVLDIDSGGGQVYGTPEFYDFIQNFSKPIVAYTDGYLCSAAYYIGNATNYIVANKRADAIGSIGAYASFLDFTGMFEKWGAKDHTIYATKSTAKNSEFREVLKGNYEPYIKNVLDPMVETFHQDMQSSRPGLDTSVFKGGTWGAEKSLELGLIDEIGTLETAIMKVVELSNSEKSNSNNSDMSKENSFPKLAAVLGVEGIEAKKANIFSANETVSLSVEQLAQIEAALTDPGDSQKLADLQTQLDAANSGKKTAENKATALETAVYTALEKAGLTAEKKATSAENIDFLADKVVEYGSKDGGNPTDVYSEGDPNDPINEESTSIFDSIAN